MSVRPKCYLTSADVIERLRDRLQSQSIAEFALQHSLSASYIRMILKGERLPGLELTTKLGLKRVIVYEEIPLDPLAPNVTMNSTDDPLKQGD